MTGLNVLDPALEDTTHDIIFALTLDAVLLQHAVLEQRYTALEFLGVDDDGCSLLRVALAEPEEAFHGMNHFGNNGQSFRLVWGCTHEKQS